MRVRFVLLALVAFSLAGRGDTISGREAGQPQSEQPKGEAPKPSTDVFVSGSEEQIIKAVQEETHFLGEPDLQWFTILQNIWYERSNSHPKFAWDVLRRSRVKVVIGTQLAQAYRNKMISLNVEDMRKFALASYADPDRRLASSSVLLLAHAGSPADIPLLERLARSGSAGRRMFKEATTALVHICGAEAERAIRALLVDAAKDDREFAEAWLSNRDLIVGARCQ